MRPSSPSASRSTQVPIKVQHRAAKRKAIRRRRVDLNCGCSYYVHINCHNHGFTHRGTHHCSSGDEWRLYLGGSKSPLFQDHPARQPAVQHAVGHNNRPDTVQPQPEESVGTTPMLDGFQGLDDLTASDLAFLEGI
ncbi:transcriptional transactivator protein [Sri Lankan cassava mosaic virus-[Colombo]]|uniref:Transcriptional activator protein n=1 Tax=Sri Lankan cassava mosaic virus-[Colombo] TaxID=223328 RepID=Q8UYX0_9GEMI|nr:transcriptional transactivator protein [Sri Lankan cassava mosaic virus-[Colombo]]CAC85459.1 transcriptional transactivator protein [Sri Lankan cassava mosaic virus-[Colombo]]